jgi:hypothetical protein
MVQTSSAVADVRTTLAVARQLFNNPPSMHASPSVVEQWCYDIDQLVIATINTPHHERGWQEPAATHSRSPLAARALPSTCVPHQPHMPPSIAMADLCDELICCRRGKDSRITIERHRERHCNIEGCNFERDFESLEPAREVPATHAIRPQAPQ